MRILIVALLLSGCAAAELGMPSREQADLSRELAGRVAGRAESCVSAGSSQSLQIVDASTLVYRSGDTIWLNRLRAACPGLRPFDTLIIEVRGSQYCKGDQVRSLLPGTTIPGPVCPLGDFTPYRLPR